MLGELSRRDELHPIFYYKIENLRYWECGYCGDLRIHLLKVFPSRWIFLIITVK